MVSTCNADDVASELVLAASAPLAEKSAKICDAAAEPATDAFMALAVSASESAMAAASKTTELRSEEGRQTATAAAAARRAGLADAEADAEEVDGANALRGFDKVDDDEEEKVCNRREVEAVDGRADADAGAGCLLLDFADSADEDADADAGRERALLLLLPAVAFAGDDANTSDETATDATAGSLGAAAVVL